MNIEYLTPDPGENTLPFFNHGYFQLSIGMVLRQQDQFSVVSAVSRDSRNC